MQLPEDRRLPLAGGGAGRAALLWSGWQWHLRQVLSSSDPSLAALAMSAGVGLVLVPVLGAGTQRVSAVNVSALTAVPAPAQEKGQSLREEPWLEPHTGVVS